MTRDVQVSNHPKGSQPRPTKVGRTYQIMIRVNREELAELEHRRTLTGIREMGAFVRTAVLAQDPPHAIAPELNRAAWLALAEHLARMQDLVCRLEGLADRPRGGLSGLIGRGRLDEAVTACLEELRVQSVKIQALRRSLLGSDRVHR